MEEKLTKKSYFVDSTFSIEKYNFQTNTNIIKRRATFVFSLKNL